MNLRLEIIDGPRPRRRLKLRLVLWQMPVPFRSRVLLVGLTIDDQVRARFGPSLLRMIVDVDVDVARRNPNHGRRVWRRIEDLVSGHL